MASTQINNRMGIGGAPSGPAGPLDPLMNEHEVAAILGVRVATLRKWRWAGGGPRYRKIGATVRYSSADLASFIEACGRDSTSQPAAEAT